MKIKSNNTLKKTKRLFIFIFLLTGISYGIYGTGVYTTDAVSITYPTPNQLDEILKNSDSFKTYEELRNSTSTEKAFGSYSKSYLKKHPKESALVKEELQGKIYCGDTMIYSISGESPSQFVGKLKGSTYYNFWSGSWFHTFVHNLTMLTDNPESKKKLFPTVPGWRLDGVLDYFHVIYDKKVQAIQNAYQITRVDDTCAQTGGKNCPLLTMPHDLDSSTPVGVGEELLKRLKIDIDWFNSIPNFPFTKKALVIGQGLGADIAYQVSKETKSNDINYIYLDPYKMPKDVKGIIQWNKPSIDFADFRINKNLFSGRIVSSAKARAQALELYTAIKKVVEKNLSERDPRCDDYARLNVCYATFEFIDRKEPLVRNPTAECSNEEYPVHDRFLKPFDPEIKADKTRFDSTGNFLPVAAEAVYQDSNVTAVGGYLDNLFKTSTQGGGRSTDGRLHFTSYGSAGDKTPDSNTKAKRGNHNNLLTLGSVALSPNLIKEHNPAYGAEILVNDVHVGYYDDSSASSYKGTSIVNTIDIYDPDNKYNDALFRVIPAGKWKLTLGPVRAQIPNVPGKVKSKDPKNTDSGKNKTEVEKSKGSAGGEPELPTGKDDRAESNGPHTPLLPPPKPTEKVQLTPGSANNSADNGSVDKIGRGDTTNTSQVSGTTVGKFLNSRSAAEEKAAILRQAELKRENEVVSINSEIASTTPSIFSKLTAPFKTLWGILFSK